MTTVIAHNVYIRTFGFVLIAAVVAFFSPSRTIAADAASCPAEPQQAINAAREALRSQDASADRTALLCLIEAVAAIDERLSDTLAGRIEFEKVTSKAYFPSTIDASAEAK